MADEIAALKDFRDTVLLQTSVEKNFVRLYYKISPSLADFMHEHETIRAATRFKTTPVVYGVRYPKTFALVLLYSIIAITLTLGVRGLIQS